MRHNSELRLKRVSCGQIQLVSTNASFMIKINRWHIWPSQRSCRSILSHRFFNNDRAIGVMLLVFWKTPLPRLLCWCFTCIQLKSIKNYHALTWPVSPERRVFFTFNSCWYRPLAHDFLLFLFEKLVAYRNGILLVNGWSSLLLSSLLDLFWHRWDISHNNFRLVFYDPFVSALWWLELIL